MNSLDEAIAYATTLPFTLVALASTDWLAQAAGLVMAVSYLIYGLNKLIHEANVWRSASQDRADKRKEQG